jgi:hypothetical protein
MLKLQPSHHTWVAIWFAAALLPFIFFGLIVIQFYMKPYTPVPAYFAFSATACLLISILCAEVYFLANKQLSAWAKKFQTKLILINSFFTACAILFLGYTVFHALSRSDINL